MQLTRKKVKSISIILFSAFVIVLLVGVKNMMYSLNTSSSMPIGYYKLLAAVNIHKDDLVIVCLKDSKLKKDAIEKGYLEVVNHERCDIVPLLKKVVAEAQDHIVVTGEGVFINGNFIENSRPIHTDSQGRILPIAVIDKILSKDEYFVLGDHPKSFDGRYFGIITKDEIINKAEPSFTF